jgi:sporulation protein YlmC with PRC-barrel domain/osmotically-inducible protein OsmY
MKSKILVVLSVAALCGPATLSRAAVDEVSPSGGNNLSSGSPVSIPSTNTDTQLNNNTYSKGNTSSGNNGVNNVNTVNGVTTRDTDMSQTNAYSPREQKQLDEANGQNGFAVEQLGVIRKANQIIGMKVIDQNGQKLGHVKDLALDLPNGRVVEIIVATGGVLGIDEKFVAVPPSAFSGDFSLNVLQAKFDQDQLKSATAFKYSNWNDSTGKDRVTETYTTFGGQPYFVSDQQWNKSNSSTTTADTTRTTRMGQPVTMGALTSADKLMGEEAVNTRQEKLGKIDNILVDMNNGRIVEVIVSSGGAMGVGNQLTAVPPQAFQWNSDTRTATLDTTPDTLHTSRQFSYTDWSAASDRNNIADVYSTYHVQPYFATDADNTARNVRDRAGDSMTADNAGNSGWEVQTAASIRKNLVSNQNLSTDAKNVKIIVNNGRVTLRGPVNSENEKQIIGDAAADRVGADKVDNRLEVIGSRSSSTDNNMTPTQAPVSDMNK